MVHTPGLENSLGKSTLWHFREGQISEQGIISGSPHSALLGLLSISRIWGFGLPSTEDLQVTLLKQMIQTLFLNIETEIWSWNYKVGYNLGANIQKQKYCSYSFRKALECFLAGRDWILELELLLLLSREETSLRFKTTTVNSIMAKINSQEARTAQTHGQEVRGGHAGRLGQERKVGTYSQRTIKDVNTALYTNLTASSPPQKGKQAGEKKGWKFRALC